MSTRFDPATGRVRVSRPVADALVGWAEGREPSADQRAGLDAAGLVERGRPHPALAPLLEALADPVCRLRLVVAGDETVRGAVAPAVAALLLRAPGTGPHDETWELVGVDPAFLPATLARIVRLGPRRRRTDEPQQLSAGELDALLAGGEHLRWTAEVDWSTGGGGVGTRRLDVVDQLPRGVWLVEPVEQDRVVLWPTTPTAIWRSLTTLLPGDHELGDQVEKP